MRATAAGHRSYPAAPSRENPDAQPMFVRESTLVQAAKRAVDTSSTMSVHFIFRCQFCDAQPDPLTQMSLETAMRESTWGAFQNARSEPDGRRRPPTCCRHAGGTPSTVDHGRASGNSPHNFRPRVLARLPPRAPARRLTARQSSSHVDGGGRRCRSEVACRGWSDDAQRSEVVGRRAGRQCGASLNADVANRPTSSSTRGPPPSPASPTS